ncbi:MAG: MgtC/SapB family protein [Treponema sp.]
MITNTVIVFRLFLSFCAGAVIGLERSSKRQAAGMRTHILICLGAASVMLLSIWLTEIHGSGDPGRIAAQVVSGMGFLGGGAILKLGANVKGLTTAASIWVVACIGLVTGCGMYAASITMIVLTMITLSIMHHFERLLFPARQNKFLEIHFTDNEIKTAEITEILSNYAISVLSTNVRQSKREDSVLKLILCIDIPKQLNIRELTNDLQSLGNITKISLKEK